MNLISIVVGFMLLSALTGYAAPQQTNDQQLARELELKLCHPSDQPEDVVSSEDVAILKAIQANRLDEVRKMGSRGLDALMYMAKSRDSDLQSCALTYLVQLHDTKVVPLLRQVAADSLQPKAYRIKAIAQLGYLKASEATGTLITLFQGDDPELIQVSAQALGFIGGSEARNALRSALADPRYKNMRAITALALGRSQDKLAVHAIAELAAQQHSRYELSPYLTALAEIGTPEALEAVGNFIGSLAGDEKAAILSIYGQLMLEKSETTDDAEKQRLQQVIKKVCALQDRTCP